MVNKIKRGLTLLTGAAFLITALVYPHAGQAASTIAVDAGGGGSTLMSSNPVTITSNPLSLVKQARNLGGTVLPNGSSIASGQQIYFVLYIDNNTITSAENIQLTDLLDESQWTYVPNSLETAVVSSGSNDAAIWAGTWAVQTDAVGGPDDFASITDSGGPAGLDRLTIGAVSGQVNQNLDIPSNQLRVIRFRVTVN